MADKLLLESDNIVTWTGLTDAETGLYVNDATMVMSLFEKEPFSPNAAVAVDKGGGLVGIPATAHGQVGGDYIKMVGSQNYNDEYAVHADTTADEIVITATYAAETFTGNEKIYIGVPGGTNITLDYVAASDGVYKGNLPDTLKGVEEYTFDPTYEGGEETGLYRLFVEAVKDTARRTKNMDLQADYEP